MAVPPGFADVAMRTALTGDSEEFITTFGLILEQPLSQSVVDGLSLECAAFWLNTTYGGRSGAHIPTQGEYRGIRVTEGNDGDPIGWESVSGAAVGVGTTTLLTQNTTYLVKKGTALGGRANRGRWYLPFVREANVSDTGVLTAATVTFLSLGCAEFLDNLETSVPLFYSGMCLLHASGATPTPVSAITPAALCATQRRRLRP